MCISSFVPCPLKEFHITISHSCRVEAQSYYDIMKGGNIDKSNPDDYRVISLCLAKPKLFAKIIVCSQNKRRQAVFK